MPEVIKVKDLSKVINSGPKYFTGGFSNILGTFQNPDPVGIDTYERMLTDETCRYGFEILKHSVMSRIGEYVHENSKITDFVNEQFESMYGSIYTVVEELLSAIWAGCSVGEIVCDLNSDGVRLNDIQFLHPKTVEFELHTEGPQKNRIKSVKQRYSGLLSGSENCIPIEKMIIYTHLPEFGNPYGLSRFRSIYPVWHIKNNLLAFWARTLEKYATPTAKLTMDSTEGEIEDENGERMSLLEYGSRILQSLQTGSGVVLTPGLVLEFLQTQRPLGDDFFKAIDEYCNKMTFRGLLTPSLIADKSGTGSYSQSQTHFEAFLFVIDKLTREIIDVLLDQLIRKLIMWNFGIQKSWGNFQFKEFKPDVGKLLSEIVGTATTQGYLSPDRYDDFTSAREMMGLPTIPKADWQKQQDEKQKKADEIVAGLAGKGGVVDEKSPDTPDEKNQADKTASGGKEEKLNGILNGLSTFGGDYAE